MSAEEAIWHEVECGGYEVDLPLWRTLAMRHDGPILDVGAGTGRVAIDLAEAGHEVTALESDPALLEVLADRAREAGVPVDTVCGDAREYRSPVGFGLIIVPMQTVQLFGGAAGRRTFFSCALGNLSQSGVLAVAVADMSPGDVPLPASFAPDVISVGDSVYASRPVCVSREGDRMVIERERVRTANGVEAERASYRLAIDDVGAAEVSAEARAEGFRDLARELIAEDGPYLGAEVVVLGA